MGAKPHAEAIRLRLEELEAESWLGPERSSWPRYLYHVTDVQNAASILASGRLLSRKRASDFQEMRNDNASQSVISATDDTVHDYVRLYFRPKTPTFFHNEGIRRISDRTMDCHCPIPVGLLFDSYEILSRSDSKFSRGNLASDNTLYQSAADFAQLPFPLIYHNRAIYQDEDKQAIIFHRHAEVVVPNELPLDSLRIVATRSSAELTTLRTLLLTRYSSQRTIWRQGLSKTNVAPEFFYCRWSFIENVQRDGDSIFVSFNADTESPGPYDVRLQWKNTKSTATSIAKLTADRSYQVRIPDGFKQGSFTLEIRLDDSLAFVGPMALIRPTLFHG